MGIGVIIAGGADPGDWKRTGFVEGRDWEYTGGGTYAVGAVGSSKSKSRGSGIYGSFRQTDYEQYKLIGGTDENWNMMMAAGYQWDPQLGSLGDWAYKGDPSCSFDAVSATLTDAQRQKYGMDPVVKAMADCHKSKGTTGSGNGKGKCCCCCCCKKKNGNGGTTATLDAGKVYFKAGTGQSGTGGFGGYADGGGWMAGAYRSPNTNR